MPAVREPRHSMHYPPGHVLPRHLESSHHGRVRRRQRGSSASVRLSRNQPRARIDQRPYHEEPPRNRIRSAGHERIRHSPSRVRRIRPEITIVSVSPMAEHPAFADGSKGAYIPPEAPPSYEQAMRTSTSVDESTHDTSITNHIPDIQRIFPQRHIVNSDAVTIPSYSESISQQLHPTVTPSPIVTSPSSEQVVSVIRTRFTPRRTSGIVSSQSDPSFRSDIAARRDVRPTETNQGVRRSQPNVTRTNPPRKPPKPALPRSRPVLPPKPKPRSSANRNVNNNSNKDEEERTLQSTSNSDSLIVTQSSQTMTSATNQDILSLFDSPPAAAPAANIHAPILPNSSAPNKSSSAANQGQAAAYSNLDGLFSVNPPQGGAPTPTSNMNARPSNSFSNLDGLFSSLPQGGSSEAAGMNANSQVGGAAVLAPNSPYQNPSVSSQLRVAPHDQSNHVAQPTMNGNAPSWLSSGAASLANQPPRADPFQSLSGKPEPAKRSLPGNNGPIDTSQTAQVMLHSTQIQNQTIGFLPQGQQQNYSMLTAAPVASGGQHQPIQEASSPVVPLQAGSAESTPSWTLGGAAIPQLSPGFVPVQDTRGPSVSTGLEKPQPPPKSFLIGNNGPNVTSQNNGLSSNTPNLNADAFFQSMLLSPQKDDAPLTQGLGSTVAQPAMMQPTQLPPHTVTPSPVSVTQTPSPSVGTPPPPKTSQSRKLPPPPRPSSGPRRASSVKPTTAPPPRPTAKPKGKPPTAEASLIDVFSTKPDQPSQPEGFSQPPSIFNQSNPTNPVQNSPNMGTGNLLGPSLLDDLFVGGGTDVTTTNLLSPSSSNTEGLTPSKPPPPIKPVSLLTSTNQPVSMTTSQSSLVESEPVYAVVNKKKNKGKGSTAATPPSVVPSLDSTEPTKPESVAEKLSNPPPPLPKTRPPLEDFEDLLSHKGVDSSPQKKELRSNASKDLLDDLFGMFTPQNDKEEDPYELVVEGLPHVKQTTAPPILPASRKKKNSLKNKDSPPPLPTNNPKQHQSGAVIYSKPDSPGSPSATVVERRKSEDSESKFTQKLRKKSKIFKQMKIFKSTKSDESIQPPSTEDPPSLVTPIQTKSESKPSKPARPPPRPAALPKKPPSRPPTSPMLSTSPMLTINNNIIPPVTSQPQPSAKPKPTKPPPPKIVPARSAPVLPPANTNQNNRAVSAPSPKPRSNSKPDPPLKASPVPKERSIPGNKAIPSRVPPPKPPTKRYGNLRPPPAPKPVMKKPVNSISRVEVEDGRAANQSRSKVTMVAIFDFNGGASDELKFKAGDTLSDVTEVNDDWYRGRLGGRSGIFPKGFVAADAGVPSNPIQPLSDYPTTWDDEPYLPALEDSTPDEQPSDIHPTESAELQWGTEVSDAPSSDQFHDTIADEVAGAGTLNSVPGERSEPSNNSATGECSEPSNNSVTAECSELSGNSVTGEQSKSGDSQKSRSCVALFTFEGQDDSELSFDEGRVIKIVGEVNEEWLIGKVDGKEGMFPVGFVQIHGESKPATEDSANVVEASSGPPVQSSLPSSASLSGFLEPMATGVEDYTATSSEEISFKAGDVLYLLERVDENWLMVQHDTSSAVGNVPISHIDIVHPLP